ncbi:MAG: hypothetical protein VXY93_16655, partial [Pseudomonadota bacterium]|nr:hypothetical protein [Pseudomonadota bacterium]
SDGEISLRAQDRAGFTNAKFMTFYTQESGSASGSERVRITSGGNVGIGTNSPYNTGLDVRFPLTTVASFTSLANGTQGADVSIIHTKSGITDNDKVGQISFKGGALGNATTYAQIRAIATDISNKKGDIAFYMRNGNNTTGSLIDDERVRITSDGKVGIGTDNPQEILHVLQSGTTAAEFRLENNEGYLLVRADNNIATYGAQQHLFHNRANSTEYLRITSSGNVGI